MRPMPTSSGQIRGALRIKPAKDLKWNDYRDDPNGKHPPPRLNLSRLLTKFPTRPGTSSIFPLSHSPAGEGRSVPPSP